MTTRSLTLNASELARALDLADDSDAAVAEALAEVVRELTDRRSRIAEVAREILRRKAGRWRQ